MALTREQLAALAQAGADASLALGPVFPGIAGGALLVGVIGRAIASQAGAPQISPAEFAQAEAEALTQIEAELARGDSAAERRRKRREGRQ